MMKGFDMNIISKIREVVSIPITVLGGAGNIDDVKKVIQKHGVIGVAVGSLFVFKGKYKAVLINYPDRKIKEQIYYEN